MESDKDPIQSDSEKKMTFGGNNRLKLSTGLSTSPKRDSSIAPNPLMGILFKSKTVIPKTAKNNLKRNERQSSKDR